MPLYEYQCSACGERFEAIRRFSDPPLEACSLCGKGPVTRLLSSPAIQFKGSGWYITDYARKGEASKGEGASTDAKSDSGSTKSDSGTTKSDTGTTKSGTAASAPASPAAAAKE